MGELKAYLDFDFLVGFEQFLVLVRREYRSLAALNEDISNAASAKKGQMEADG